MTLWTPDALGSKLVAWIDPTDGTKVTSSGGAISQITDKSSNGFNATQATGAAQPATATDPDGSGLTVISNAVGKGLGLSSSILSGKTTASVYAMGRRTNPSGNGEYSQGPLIGNLTDTGHQSFHWPYAGTIYDGFCSTSRKTVGTFPSYAAWHIFSVHSEASLYEFRIDTGDGAGGATAFYTDATNTFNAGAAGTPYIGADTTPGASTYSWLGYIGPVVLTDGTETSGERAQIEGYLAWRMGQQALLPSGHTYHSAAPQAAGGAAPILTFRRRAYLRR